MTLTVTQGKARGGAEPMTAPCATGCPFLACPSCPYRGGPSERGTRHVSAGETVCRGVVSGPACETIEDVSDPRERRNSGGPAGTYVGGPTA